MPKHNCANFEAQWKVDSTGSLKCVCGEVQGPRPFITRAELIALEKRSRSSIGAQMAAEMNAAALTDDHPAGKTDTSIAAFESTDRTKGQQWVENLIRASSDGLTAEQAADAMGVGQATTSARFNDLRRAGIIKRHVRRATHSGRSAWAHKIVVGM